jgi:hypothetical protein
MPRTAGRHRPGSGTAAGYADARGRVHCVAVSPPSRVRIWPVTKLLAPEQKNGTAPDGFAGTDEAGRESWLAWATLFPRGVTGGLLGWPRKRSISHAGPVRGHVRGVPAWSHG